MKLGDAIKKAVLTPNRIKRLSSRFITLWVRNRLPWLFSTKNILGHHSGIPQPDYHNVKNDLTLQRAVDVNAWGDDLMQTYNSY